MAWTKKWSEGSKVVFNSKYNRDTEYNGKTGKVAYWGNFRDESGQAHAIQFESNKNEFGVEIIWAFPKELSQAK